MLWYASRATGVVALLLLTGVMVLGMLVNRQGRLPGLPKFAVTGLHRNLSLLAAVFVAIHVLSSVADGYVNIPIISAVVPFSSPYERFWLGLGAVSLDLMVAVIVTSLLRRHLSRRAWRVVHLLSYLSWPVAWVHSFFASNDLRHGSALLPRAAVRDRSWRRADLASGVRGPRCAEGRAGGPDHGHRPRPRRQRQGYGQRNTRDPRREARERQDVHPMTATTAGAFHEGASRAAAQGDLPRLLPPTQEGKRPQNLDAHLARHGELPYRDRIGTPGNPGALVRDIEESGLTGRGGAAFPVHRKLRAVLEAADKRRRTPTVIANGAESEPASDKDATLLWLAPHLVLDGLQLAAEAVGADIAILVTHADREHDVADRLGRAVSERLAARLDRVPVQLATVPARFLSGQETALVNHLGGGPVIPTFMPPRITERGLGNAPTLVQNVETLAHLALIARRGPRWFREVGTAREPGSMLATIRRADGLTRITEVPLGLPLRDLLGAPTGQESAVLLGGYHGTWLSAAKAAALTLDNESLGPAGARVGAGIVISLPPDRCGLVETARAVRYLALESAGQCGPCLNGLPRIAAAFAELASGRPRRGTRQNLERWSGLVTGRGACHHPDGTARFVRSALRTFAKEADRHERGQCSATNTAQFLPVPDGAARSEDDWM